MQIVFDISPQMNILNMDFSYLIHHLILKEQWKLMHNVVPTASACQLQDNQFIKATSQNDVELGPWEMNSF